MTVDDLIERLREQPNRAIPVEVRVDVGSQTRYTADVVAVDFMGPTVRIEVGYAHRETKRKRNGPWKPGS